jgi:hypothetical protein
MNARDRQASPVNTADLLDEISSASFAIEQGPHPYERASEEERDAYDEKLEKRAREREARERATLDLD